MKKITPIIHLTSSCNLRCKYCYVKNKDNANAVLNHKDIKNLCLSLEKVFQYNGSQKTKIILHGGEPLMIPINILEMFLEEIFNLNNNVQINLQTNLTLLNENHCNLFEKYKIKVGFSIDGYNIEQNQFRVDKYGNNIFELVMKKYKYAQERGINLGAIITINRTHINHEQELLNFIQEKNLKCNIRPAYPTSNNNFYLTPYEYAMFFNNMFDLWYYNEKLNSFLIKDFENEILEVLNKKACKSCSESVDCSKSFLSVDPEGECYVCNRLYGIDEFYIGNLLNKSLDDIIQKSNDKLAKRWLYLKDNNCKECNIKKFCHGGCPAISYSSSGNYLNQDYFCVSYQIIKEHIKSKVFID